MNADFLHTLTWGDDVKERSKYLITGGLAGLANGFFGAGAGFAASAENPRAPNPKSAPSAPADFKKSLLPNVPCITPPNACWKIRPS